MAEPSQNVLPEFAIEKVLKEGFERCKADPKLLRFLLQQIAPKIVDDAVEWLTKHTVEIVQNMPRTDTKLPYIAIFNAGSDEQAGMDLLGNGVGDEMPTDTDITSDEFEGIAETHQYSMLISSQQPRLTIFISLLIKALIISSSVELQTAGLHNMTLRTSDLQGIPLDQLPELQNPRTVTLSCLTFLVVPINSVVIRKFNTTVHPVTGETDASE